jgi:hypothetical protein
MKGRIVDEINVNVGRRIAQGASSVGGLWVLYEAVGLASGDDGCSHVVEKWLGRTRAQPIAPDLS